MDWIKLIIGLVVVIAWIAGNIREKQKAAEKAAPPPLPPADTDATGAAAKADDLQDFLKQLRRRTGESEPGKIEEPMGPVLVEEAPRVEPQRREPPVVNVPKPKKRRRPDATPNRPRPTAEPTSPPPGAVNALAASDSAPLVDGRAKASSAAARDVVRLLKSPSGMATAFVLREILGDPHAKRRRMR